MAWSANQGMAPQQSTQMKSRVNARSKGRRGEQEVATMLRGVVAEVLGERHRDVEIKRNLMQWAGTHRAEGQGDIVGFPWMSIEVKRVENDLPSGLETWWTQTKAQANKSQIPVLFHRMNGRDWNVRFPLETVVNAKRMRLTVDMSWTMFSIWLKERIKQEYGLD